MATAEGKLKQQDFIKALEEERSKIQMFPKELPLSLRLVSEAIENLRWIARGEDSSEGPVIEEFFPLRPSSSSGSDDSLPTDKGKSDFKQDWLKSVQICDTVVPNEPQPCGESTLRKPVAVYAKAGGAFHPFEKDKPVLADTVSSGTATAIGGRRDDAEEVDKEKEGHCPVPAQTNRKQRRCWSADLHRKFLNVLEQLGGSRVATPKQIRELMEVDGLTNDEVKSHLQKYRLHTRRPAATVQSSSSSSRPPTPPQFVVVGGIWVPAPGYAAVAASSAAAAEPQPPEGSCAPLNRIYSPVASMPLESGLQEEEHKKKQLPNLTTTMPLHSQQKCSQHDDSSSDDAASESNSSSTSISHRP